MTAIIESVDAWELLDSRGEPTVHVSVTTDSGRGTFTVPAGASVGAYEAVERRDGGDRFGGKGVRNAVAAARGKLADTVRGLKATDQAAVDAALVRQDGTEALSRFGANAVLGVSGAVAHAAADSVGEPLYRYLGDGRSRRLPCPMVNVLSGGLHAQGGIEVQDFLVIPAGAESYREALETAWDVRAAVRERIVDAGERPLMADEGGFSPQLATVDEGFDLLAAGVRDAGYRPVRDGVAFAVDVAASHFYDAERDVYDLESLGLTLDAAEMADLVLGWVADYPLVSIEDPLAENDWEGWRTLADRLDDDVQLVGDDLIATDESRLRRAIEEGVANAVLVKPNQAGTISRTEAVIDVAARHDVNVIVSARSGETCDATIADLSVAHGTGQIKIGSLARSERLAKYNRLLEIARATDYPFAPFRSTVR